MHSVSIWTTNRVDNRVDGPLEEAAVILGHGGAELIRVSPQVNGAGYGLTITRAHDGAPLMTVDMTKPSNGGVLEPTEPAEARFAFCRPGPLALVTWKKTSDRKNHPLRRWCGHVPRDAAHYVRRLARRLSVGNCEPTIGAFVFYDTCAPIGVSVDYHTACDVLGLLQQVEQRAPEPKPEIPA